MDLILGDDDKATLKDVFRDLRREYRENAASKVKIGDN